MVQQKTNHVLKRSGKEVVHGDQHVKLESFPHTVLLFEIVSRIPFFTLHVL